MREEFKPGDRIEITHASLFFNKGAQGTIIAVCEHATLYVLFDNGAKWYVSTERCKKLKTKKGIKIKVEKFVDRAGNRMVRILDIEALPWDKLPQEYKDGECVYLCPKGMLMYKKNQSETCFLLARTWNYDVFYFSCAMETIKRCGERLAEINRKNRTKKKEKQDNPQKKREWSGEKEYVI